VVIVVWIGKRLVGLLVEAVCDILAVSGDALQPTPSLPSQTVGSLVSALVTVGDRMVGLVDLDHVLPPLEGEAA
jgi:purine-binding chemotaxis protein CheW